jgi:hypothetical protein
MHFPKRRGKFPAQSHVVFAAAVTVEAMEERVLMTAFTQGNLAVLDLATNTSNSSGSILELSPSTAAQLTPVQTIAIPATGVNAMRFSNSGTSSYLSDTNDHTLLALTGYNTADTTDSDLATVTAADPANDRAVATLNNSAAYALQTTYTGVTGNQIRSASSTDNSHWYIADKGGLYTNNATTASDALNIGQVRSFGGTVYVSTTRTVAQGNTANSAITTAASPTASSFTGLPGIAVDANIADFYLIQSGSNGANYDILYKLDGTSITKYSLVSGSWTSNGTYTLPTAGLSMIAANDGAGGANLYYTTGTSVVQLTDTTGWVNSTTASTTNFTVTTANNVTLYTATGTNFLKGLDFAPVAPAPIPSIASVATNPTFVFQGSGTISLSATVSETGGSASSVSFYREAANGTENPAVDTLIAGTATNAGGTWTLGGVSTSGLAVGTYSYYAVATDSTHATVSTTSPVATLTVYTQAPTVTSQPASQYAAAGASVAFTSTGVGSPTPSVQWQVLTAPGGTWMNLVDTAGQISGSGMPTLTLSGLTEGQSGYQYRAVFMSSSGTALSNPATLTVTGTPIAQWIFPGGEAPPTGGSTAVGTGNSPLPSYGSSNDVAGTLGLSNDYTGVQAFPESDILVERSTLDPAFSEFDWRIRSGNGSGPTGSPGTPEGWSQNAPQYAQGVQFDVDTTGYSNITLHFDWNQGGISDMQPIYSTNGGTSWTPLPAELIEQTTPKGDFYGLNPGTTTTAAYSLIAGASSAVSVASSMGFTLNETVIIGSINCTVTAITPGVLTVTPAATGSVASGAAVGQTPTGILVNLQSIAGANNNPNFELQLAAAYNATLPLITDGNLDLNGGNTSIAHGQYATGVAGPVNAQQVIQFGSNENSTSDVTGGTFTLSYGGVPTAAISYSSTPATLAANISAALSALTINGVPHYLSGNFTVAQTNTPGVNPERDGLGVVASDMTVTFSGALASTAVATMTANGSALTGNSPSISVATWVNGSTMGFQPYVDGSGAWQIGNISFNGDGVSAGGLAIINQPASLTAITSSAGHPATASFTATSYSENPTTAQWQINTGSGWNNITGATNISQSGSTWTSTYSFPTDTTTDQSGNQYRVVFTALGNGVTSNAATLTVVAPVVPSIVLQPIATSVQAGNTAILLASATGTPLPTVQWQINNGSGWNNIAGATSTTLQYTTLVDGSENGDQIRAVFTNQAGSATSNAVVLTVLAAETDVTNWDFTNHSTIVTPTTIVPLTGLATTAGSNTITVTSTTGLTVGQAITGTNIPAGSLITAITDAATFTISTTPTVTGSLGVGSATAAGFDNSPAPTGGSLDVGAAYPEPTGMVPWTHPMSPIPRARSTRISTRIPGVRAAARPSPPAARPPTASAISFRNTPKACSSTPRLPATTTSTSQWIGIRPRPASLTPRSSTPSAAPPSVFRRHQHRTISPKPSTATQPASAPGQMWWPPFQRPTISSSAMKSRFQGWGARITAPTKSSAQRPIPSATMFLRQRQPSTARDRHMFRPGSISTIKSRLSPMTSTGPRPPAARFPSSSTSRQFPGRSIIPISAFDS